MYLRIVGCLGFLVGTVVTITTVASDIYKIALYGILDDTALEFCLNAAYKAGFSYPNTMAIMLWLAPLTLMIIGLFFFAGNQPRVIGRDRILN